mgnify:CR=1 FL=1
MPGSPVFENVSLGEHTITVWDTEGGIASSCDPLVITEVQTIDYPHYFTPNGDGFNDAFKVSGLSVYNLDFKIYNRYGQVICNLKSVNQTWNGDDSSGYFAQSGVYDWYATYNDDKGFGHTAQGHIVLIR